MTEREKVLKLLEDNHIAYIQGHRKEDLYIQTRNDLQKQLISLPIDTPPKTQVDMVNHPTHYANRSYEVIDVMKDTMSPERFKGYLEGCVLKYMMRWDKKGTPLQDAQKAQWYLNKLIETIKEETP